MFSERRLRISTIIFHTAKLCCNYKSNSMRAADGENSHEERGRKERGEEGVISFMGVFMGAVLENV